MDETLESSNNALQGVGASTMGRHRPRSSCRDLLPATNPGPLPPGARAQGQPFRRNLYNAVNKTKNRSRTHGARACIRRNAVDNQKGRTIGTTRISSISAAVFGRLLR